MGKARDWTKSHPFIAVAVASLLSFTAGAGGSDSASVQAQLVSAQEAASEAEAEKLADIAALESARAELESEIEALEQENEAFQEKVQQLNAKRELPRLVGDLEALASDLEDEYGWNLKISYEFSSSKAGTILAQNPAPGTMMNYGAPFKVTVAKVIPKVPDLVGLSKAKAVKAARNANYEIAIVEQVSSSKPGTVITMTPSGGSRVIPGGTVTLTIAKKATPPPPSPPADAAPSSGCTPGYDPCLPPASDYDCAGGSGDGPKYTGPVKVTGSDPYGLDTDSDGWGCES